MLRSTSGSARLLASQIASDQREEAVFEIAGHFNRAAALLVSQEERDEVAALNLAAGKRAKKAAAYVSALNLFDRRGCPSLGRGVAAPRTGI